MVEKKHVLKPVLLSEGTTKSILGGDSLRTNSLSSIAGYLQNFCAGRAATPCSDFYSNRGFVGEAVLSVAQATAEKWQVPRIRAYDLSRSAKYGPQGFIYPLGSDEQIEKFEGYFTYCHAPCKPSEAALKLIKE